MSSIRPFLVCVFLFMISIYHASCQDPLPIMHLDDPDNLGCLRNDIDLFTVRGNVSKNGANPDAYIDTNLYLQAVKDPSTNAWASQCRPDLTVCEKDLNTDFYCESIGADGYYRVVMNIMAKSIYSGGQLMLSWNDNRSPYNPPITSNQVHYYPGPICEPINATLTTGNTETILDTDPCPNKYKKFLLDFKPDMTNLTFCVYNLKAIGLVQIAESDEILEQTTTEPCVSIPLNHSQSQMLILSFRESGGCERSGSYNLSLGTDRPKPTPDSGLEVYIIVIIVICCVVIIVGVVIVTIKYCSLTSCCSCCSSCCSMCKTKISHDDDKESPDNTLNSQKLAEVKLLDLHKDDTLYEKMYSHPRFDTRERRDQEAGREPRETQKGYGGHWEQSNIKKSAISNDITMTEKKKKRKMKETETAHEEAIENDKANAQDGSPGEQRVDAVKARENASPRRPLPPISSDISMSYWERNSSIVNDIHMTGVKKKRKMTTDTETVHKGGIDKEEINEQNESPGEQKEDVLMVRGKMRHPVPLAPTSDVPYMPNDEQMSAISNDLAITYEKMKKKKKKKKNQNQMNGTEAGYKTDIDSDTIYAHNVMPAEQRGDMERVGRKMSSPSLTLKEPPTSAWH